MKTKYKFITIILLITLIFNSCIQNNIVKAIETEEDMEIIKTDGSIHKENIDGILQIVQKYNVNLKDEISEYSISISGFPEGARILDSSDNEINKIKDKRFKIAIPQKNIGVEFKGTINIDGHIYTFNEETNISEVKVKSVYRDGSAVQNATIELRQGETVVASKQTNEDGEAIFSNVYPGFYAIYEKNEAGELMLEDGFGFSVIFYEDNNIRLINDRQKNVNIKVENEKKKGTIEIHVVDAENHDIKLENIEIEICEYYGPVVETLRTDANGVAVSSRLPLVCTYTVKQKNTAENYNMNFAEKNVNFSDNGENVVLQFENSLKRNFIKITKVDKDNNEVKLKGVVFGIYNSEDELIEEITTDSKGEAVSSNLPVNKEYRIKEIKTLDKYVLDTNVITVYLTEDGQGALNQNEEENEKIGLKTIDKKEVIRLSSQKNFLIIENQKINNSLPKLGC